VVAGLENLWWKKSRYAFSETIVSLSSLTNLSLKRHDVQVGSLGSAYYAGSGVAYRELAALISNFAMSRNNFSAGVDAAIYSAGLGTASPNSFITICRSFQVSFF
jgi:hypothetical protein